MKLSYTFSTLTPLVKLNRVHQAKQVRTGILVRGESEEGVGYFEYFPWEQFGDIDENKFLEEIKKIDSTTRKRVESHIETVATFLRDQKDATFNNHQLIYPHTEVNEIHSPIVKIKYLGSLTHLTQSIYRIHNTGKKIRVDFNFALTLNELTEFLTSIEEIATSIDFIEDPIKFSEEDYALLAAWKDFIRIDIPFNQSGNDCGLDRVYKPTVNPILIDQIKENDIFSSYMGHPIGKILCTALLFKYGTPTLFHGIDTPPLYEGETPLFTRDDGKLSLQWEKVKQLVDELEGLEWKSF